MTDSTGGTVPTSLVSIANAILSRSIRNNAGQVVETDDYYNVTSGFTYSTDAVRIGSAWDPAHPDDAANYYVTLLSYNHRGLLIKRSHLT